MTAGDPVPFIVGTGRCGTTFLRLMLDAHPALAIPPETHFIPGMVKQCAASSNAPDCFIERLTSYITFPDFHINIDSLTQRIKSLKPFTVSEGFRVFYTLYAENLGKSRWGDKTPGYFAHMKHIQKLFPEVHFIHMIRDGRDVALSILNLSFGPNSIEEAARWWVMRMKRARGQATHVQHYMEVRYEDLVLDSESKLKQICSFIDLKWDSSMLQYYERANERLKEDEYEIHRFTTRPPQASRVQRWKQEMALFDRRLFESIAGELLKDLGYEI